MEVLQALLIAELCSYDEWLQELQLRRANPGHLSWTSSAL